MMPYNQVAEEDRISVSSDAVSDLPDEDWEVPETLTKVYLYRLSRMWLDWAR